MPIYAPPPTYPSPSTQIGNLIIALADTRSVAIRFSGGLSSWLPIHRVDLGIDA